MNSKKNIAIFISGKGSNAKNIIDYFHDSTKISVKFVFTTGENYDLLDFCLQKGVQFFSSNDKETHTQQQITLCSTYNIDWVILAGYLKKIPVEFISRLNHKIINLHPSLLPKFGGKGMYGKNVHAAVLAEKEKKSGITIHLVNEVFDEGKIMNQYECEIDMGETIASLEGKINALEQRYFPNAILTIIEQMTIIE